MLKENINNKHMIPFCKEWVWLLFLAGWMQGMLILNITWVLLMVVCLPHGLIILKKTNNIKPMAYAVLIYEIIRILTSCFSAFPLEATCGLFDDFRAISIGLAALLFVQNEQQLIKSAWASFIGFTVLAWWALLWQLMHFGLQTNGDIIFGIFGHLNYAAVYSIFVLLTMTLVFIHVSFKKSWLMLLGMLPIIIMQVPLESRATIASAIVAIFCYVLWKPSIKKVAVIFSIGCIFLTTSYIQDHSTFDFLSIKNTHFITLSFAEEKNEIDATLAKSESLIHDTSMKVRFEIWGLLWQIIKDHPLGIGPRNHGFIDLSSYYDWMDVNMPTLKKNIVLGGETATTRQLINFQVSYDPHSQYMDTLVDTSVLGILSLFGLWMMMLLLSRLPYPKHPWVMKIPILMIFLYALCGVTVALFHQAGLIMFFLLYGSLAFKGKETA